MNCNCSEFINALNFLENPIFNSYDKVRQLQYDYEEFRKYTIIFKQEYTIPAGDDAIDLKIAGDFIYDCKIFNGKEQIPYDLIIGTTVVHHFNTEFAGSNDPAHDGAQSAPESRWKLEDALPIRWIPYFKIQLKIDRKYDHDIKMQCKYFMIQTNNPVKIGPKYINIPCDYLSNVSVINSTYYVYDRKKFV